MNIIFPQIWIHKSYPYIQKVHRNSNQNEFEIVSALNQAASNPNLELLQQEIGDVEQLLNIAESKHSDYANILENQMGTNTVNFLLSCDIRKYLTKQLDYLQNLLLELNSPQEITVLDLDQYQIKRENPIEVAQNVPPLELHENEWGGTFPSFIIPDKKIDPDEIVPSPLKIKNLFSDRDLLQFQTLNWNGWLAVDKDFEFYNNQY